MKFVCDQKSIVDYLSCVAKFVSKNHPTNSLVNLELEDDMLTLRSFSGSVYLEISLLVVGEIDGNILVNPTILFPIIKTLGEGDVFFHANSKLQVQQGNNCRDVSIQDGEEFLKLPYVAEEFRIETTPDDLLAAMKTVRFAKAVDNSEYPVLNGYYVDTEENLLMAGDGRRVAYTPFVYNDGNYKFTLPPQTFDVLTSVHKLVGGDSLLLQGGSASWLGIELNGAMIRLGTLYGEYPTAAMTWLKQLREDTTGTVATFNKDELVSEAKISITYSGLAARAHTFQGVRIDLNDHGVRFMVKSPDGNLDDFCDLVPVSGEPTWVSLFPPYLLQAATSAPEEEIDLVVWSAHKAVLLRSGDWFVVQAPFADSDVVERWRDEYENVND